MFGIGPFELLCLGAAVLVVVILPVATVVVLVTRGQTKREDRD
jgi:hypothetical protein